MTLRTVRWWPVTKPAPRGWRKARQTKNHHNRFSVLLEKQPSAGTENARAAQAAGERKPQRSGRRQSELALHKAVAKYLDLALDPQTTWWTTIGHGGGGPKHGARLKAMGVKAGVPDILIVHKGGHAFFIELKAGRGRASKMQLKVWYTLQALETRTAAVKSLAELASTLLYWGIPIRARPT